MRKLFIQVLLFSVFILVVFLLFNFEDYFAQALQIVQANKLEYSLFSFGLLVSDILLPVPSSIVMYSNGLVLGIVNGFLLSLFSSMVGSIVGYGIGRFTSTKMPSSISEEANHFFFRYGFIAIFLTRGIPILAESISLVCGFNKVEFRTYLLLSLLGYIPVCLVYAYFGNVGQDGNYFLISFALSILLSGVFWVVGKYFFKARRTPSA